MQNRTRKNALLWSAAAWLTTAGLNGQTPAATLLRIDIDNYVPYHYDVFDESKFTSVTDITTVTAGRPFGQVIIIGDIVAVNGRPAKGVWILRATNLYLTPTVGVQPPGSFLPFDQVRQSIADVVRLDVQDVVWEILQADGTPIGTIMAGGFARGVPPPGATPDWQFDNMTITGGTGAFLGVRGQAGVIDLGSPRQASVAEATANRRVLGGAKRSYVLELLPMFVPQILATDTGPAIVHTSDSSPVTPDKPARPGEVLTIYARGLGPTNPSVVPGLAFPATPLAVVNSPVEVTVGGMAASASYAGGYPGAIDVYQVDFTLPTATTPGRVPLHVSQAWIGGPDVMIDVLQ
jgi:uncharacterized protein (TIGR03437 family)